MSEAARPFLEGCLSAALDEVHGGRAVARAIERRGGAISLAGLSLPDRAGVFVLSIGKAGAAMANAACSVLGERVVGGLVVTKDGHGAEAPPRLPLVYAGHPVPDERSRQAGESVLAAAAGVRSPDWLLVLLSGGSSALTTCPAAGIDLPDLAATTEALLACGADIAAINCMRKHLTRVGGGRLARATRAERVVALALSDVPGDRLDVIGSGPCTGDPSTYADAQAIVARFALYDRLPAAVVRHLEAGVRGGVRESVKPGDPRLESVVARIVGCNADARRAVLAHSEWPDVVRVDLGECLIGEARTVGRRLAALGHAQASRHPTLLVAGGETTVTLRGNGRGGRNQELALSAALALAEGDDRAAVCLLAAGTDGTDGPTEAAGGFADAGSVARARAAGVDAARALDLNDSHRFLDACHALVQTGPTGTNVMDLALLYREPRP